MMKLLLSILLFTGITVNLSADTTNTTKEGTAIEIKNNAEVNDWIKEKEFITLANDETIHSPIVNILNSFFSFLVKKPAASNMLFAFLLFFAYWFFSFFAGPLIIIILFLNGLYYSNPMAGIGSIYDIFVLWWKLLFAIFGVYI